MGTGGCIQEADTFIGRELRGSHAGRTDLGVSLYGGEERGRETDGGRV